MNTGEQLILFETFKNLYKPEYKITTQYLIMRTLKGLGIRVGSNSVLKFFKQLQVEGYGKIILDTSCNNPRYSNNSKNYSFMCE